MAEKKKQDPPQKAPAKTVTAKSKVNAVLPVPPKKKGRTFKILLIFLVLLCLLGIGFTIGIYLKLFDFQQSAENMNLQNAPIIGKYFQKPKTNFDPVDLTPAESVPPSPGNSLTGQPALPSQLVPAPVPGEPAALDPANAQNLAKLAKQKQAQDAKKISKLARLYGNMKPEEAVPILTQFDTPTVVAILNKMDEDQAAKILAQFSPAQAAQISQAMLAVAVIQ